MFPKSEKGISIVAAVFIVVVLSILGIVVITYSITAAEETGNEYLSTQAFYNAETGIYAALIEIENGSNPNGKTYSFSSPNGRAVVSAVDNGDVWVVECTGYCGNESANKFGKRTIRVLYRK
jgi:Tfp pilus assembly protein PilX